MFCTRRCSAFLPILKDEVSKPKNFYETNRQWEIKEYRCSNDYDIAYFCAGSLTDVIPMPIVKTEIPRNIDVITHEYSCTEKLLDSSGRKVMNFITSTHKGNIIRYYTSDFPDKKPTSSFITSFPALQGASGAPIIRNDTTGIVGMIVGNIEQDKLLPAQTITVEEKNNFKEEIKYFLPQGKAIASSVIIDYLKNEGLEVKIIE